MLRYSKDQAAWRLCQERSHLKQISVSLRATATRATDAEARLRMRT
jgi:hypothetical protein